MTFCKLSSGNTCSKPEIVILSNPPHPLTCRQEFTFPTGFWTLCVHSFPVTEYSTPLDNAAGLVCYAFGTYSFINKNAKVILHSKLILRSGNVYFPVSLSLGIYGQYLPIQCFCVWIAFVDFFLLCWSNKINLFWYGDGFAMAKAKDWWLVVPFGGSWEWAEYS